MEAKQRKLSDGIEDTLEGFLKFVYRYFHTLWVITVAPHRSLSIASESHQINSNLLHSLTFLAIGSFLFALLINVYPNGILGVFDFVWITDELTQNIGAKWQDALSPTKLIITGLPIILIVSLCSVFIRYATLKGGLRAYLLFDVMYFAFGYQCSLIFILFSIESIVQALQIIFFIPEIDFSEDGGLQYGVMIFFIGLLVAIFFVPVIMLAGAYTRLTCRREWLQKKISIVAFSFIISIITFSLYANAASVPSSIKERITKSKEPSAYYLEPLKLTYFPDRSKLVIETPFVLDNPLTQSLLIEININEFELQFKVDGKGNIEKFEFLGYGLKKLGMNKLERWASVAPQKATIFIGEYSMKSSLNDFCQLLSYISKYDDNSALSAYVKTDISFIGDQEDIEIETNIFISGIEWFVGDDSIGYIGDDNKKYNKYIKSECAVK